jgi:hypothetical protein
MSSTLHFLPGFGNSRQRDRFWVDSDGALATTIAKSTDDIKEVLDLTDYLASGETVSSAAYSDRGITTSSKSVSTPQVLFTMTGYGDTEVQVTLSTGRVVTQLYRIYPMDGTMPRDYA